jgi:hypothetical protein
MLLPAESASAKTNHEGRMLLEALSQGEFVVLQYKKSGVYPLTFQKPSTNAGRAGGSLIDFVFCSMQVTPLIQASEVIFEKEVSSHARLSFEVDITGHQTNPTLQCHHPPH